jgi:glycosyltransferase involved in cell wall biosynthesis
MNTLKNKKIYIKKKMIRALIQLSLTIATIHSRLRKNNIKRQKSVLFSGQCYYYTWYLSRELRNIGWKADVLNWDANVENKKYYHGEDYLFDDTSEGVIPHQVRFYIRALFKYDVFHFSNMHGIQFGSVITNYFAEHFEPYYEMKVLKKLGKKIVYTNNGCQDGVSQSSFSKWGPDSVCDICIWKNNAAVCSDEKNRSWGKFRNGVADFQCLIGGNRVDYNVSSTIHEVPEVYCLDVEFWNPELIIPKKYTIRTKLDNRIYLYHAVGNKRLRTNDSGVNIKSTHVYLPLIEKLKAEGYELELISPNEVPNKEVRFYQAQSDIFLDMLTYGWYGANAREGMMLGKPVICFIRDEWLASLRSEIPECAAELPIISATPDTVESILIDLITDKEKRLAIGKKSREFALKWHSSTAGAKRFDEIYTRLINNDVLTNRKDLNRLSTSVRN